MARVTLDGLVKSYDDETRAVDGVSLTVEEGEIVTLLGPSGCGKSTTLRCIAGLEEPTGGRIIIGDEVVYDAATNTDVPTENRSIGMMFQSYAIWPHLDVFRNVAFALTVGPNRTKDRKEIKDRVMEVLNTVGLQDYVGRYPGQLSGGQQQRVVLARCLVYRPRVLLLDEPLANLDAKLRESMRFELRDVQERFGLTTIYVTHDQSEAMALSDRMFVMSGGRVARVGTPKEVYRDPGSAFVADFLGVSNVLRGEVSKTDDGTSWVRLLGTDVEVWASSAWDVGSQVEVGIAPRAMRLDDGTAELAPDEFRFSGRIERLTFLGEETDCLIAVGEHRVSVRSMTQHEAKPGEHVGIVLSRDSVAIMASGSSVHETASVEAGH
jgi:iron(III) transport system ATP-binding protein